MSGEDVKIHDNGILINNKKYNLMEPDSLPKIYSLERAKMVEMGNDILFHSEHAFLSNFFQSPIIKDGTYYPTAEHRYQAMKCKITKETSKLQQVINAITPQEALNIANMIQDTAEWENRKEAVMKETIDEKFDQNKHLAKKLIDTGDKMLKEATKNTFFGIGAMLHSREVREDSYNGQNKMGKLLMSKRRQLATDQHAKLVGANDTQSN